jgi:hypothetical protein
MVDIVQLAEREVVALNVVGSSPIIYPCADISYSYFYSPFWGIFLLFYFWVLYLIVL